MNTLDKNIKKYFWQVRSLLPCNLREKKRMLSDLQERIGDYLEANPDADFSAVEAHFGTPQQIATAFVDEMGTTELLLKLRVRKRVIRVTAAFMAAIMLGIFTFYAVALIDFYNKTNGYLIIDQTNY